MEEKDNTTLKRKDFLIHNYLQWNDSLKEALLEQDVIGPDQANIIERRNGNPSKSRVLLDRLKFKERPGDLDTLVKVLEQTSPSFIPEWHNRWIADEVIEEMTDQRGDLIVEENIRHEAATIVHRQFGHGKRLSEHEKKALVLILCVETQKTLNIWKREIQRTEEDIANEQQLIDSKDEAIHALALELEEYIDKNKGRMPERNTKVNMGLSQHLREGQDQNKDVKQGKPPLTAIKEDIDILSKMLGASLLATEVLDKERSKVLKRVGIDEKEKGHRIKLDEELKNAIKKTATELASTDELILRKEEEYKKLQGVLQDARQDLERQLHTKEKNIGILMSEVQRAKEKASEYNLEATELKKKLRFAKNELHDWAERFEMIERGGRINYIYKRDEHILAKSRPNKKPGAANKTSELEDEESKDRVKELEDLEKQFLAKKAELLPHVVGPRGKKLKHSVSVSKMSTYRPPSSPRPGVVTPAQTVGNGRYSRLLSNSRDSHTSSVNSYQKAHVPIGNSLRYGRLGGNDTMEQNKQYRTKRWVQKGFVDSHGAHDTDDHHDERPI